MHTTVPVNLTRDQVDTLFQTCESFRKSILDEMFEKVTLDSLALDCIKEHKDNRIAALQAFVKVVARYPQVVTHLPQGKLTLSIAREMIYNHIKWNSSWRNPS